MGYYIQTEQNHNKASQIVATHGAVIITASEAEGYINDLEKAVICVIENPMFDAAAFCYDRKEFQAFNEDNSGRRKTWLVMDRSKAKELSGYNRA